MANYTLELRTIHKSNNMSVFDFDYDFYDEELKPIFEQKFIDHYYFDEIGAETVQRWKHMLRSKLNKIMPYYTQLYKTQLRTKDIDFMLNKDLRESTIRDITKDTKTSVTATQKASGESVTSNTQVGNYKESSVDNGNGSVSLTDGSLTLVSENDEQINGNVTTNDTNSTDSDGTENEVQKEVITLLSQGNIGITSSAELLTKWRETIINIDEQIINECRDMFMLIY